MVDESAVRWTSRVRLVDEVLAVLRDRIVCGHYEPGERVRQQQLADELNISRTPLREALRVLETEGLLRADGSQGVRAVTGDRDTLLAAYEVREVQDGLAARLAAQQVTDEDVEELASVIRQQEAALDPWDPERYTQLNVRFHRAIMQLSGNEFVQSRKRLCGCGARFRSGFSNRSQRCGDRH